jgi:hypothetical protein
MTALSVAILGARPAQVTASPAIAFRLRITVGGGRVHALALRCQVQIEARRRRYTEDEQRRLYELFGGATQFDAQLRPVSWAQCPVLVPAFAGDSECDVAVPCSYDLEVASAKYLHAIRDGEIPVRFLFTGTLFRVADGTMAIEPVPWDVEATWRLPAAVWRAAMDQFFPGGGWVRLRRDTIDRLQAFRAQAAVITWDEAIEALLDHAATEQTP